MHSATDRATPHLLGIFIDKFQSIIEPAYIQLNGITMLYGPNSAGKSAILDALDVIHKLTDDEENNYKIEYIWDTLCDRNSRIGITYKGMEIKDNSGTLESNWINKEVNFSKPHIDFISKVIDKEISVEFSNEGNTIKIAVDGKPLFEVTSRGSRPYNEDFSTAKTDEEQESAENDFREIRGGLIVYNNHPLFKILLPDLSYFYQIASQTRGIPFASKKGSAIKESKKIEKTSDLEMFFEEKENLFTIFGIELLPEGHFWDFHRRFSVEMNNESHSFLNKHDLKPNTRYLKSIKSGQRTRIFLLDEIDNSANIINAIIEGIRFQIKIALKRSSVFGDRGIVDSDMPAYISKGFGIARTVKESQFQDHTSAYAEARSEHSTKISYSEAEHPLNYDFVNLALKKYMNSLSGYKINAEVHISKPKNKSKARQNNWHGHRENLMVFLNVENPSGKILRFKDVGSGLSYALPILTTLWASNLSFIEQPELHLHPAAQCELGDVFICAKNLGSISVIESHSEHLLLRILRRIRESTIGGLPSKNLAVSKNEVKIYYFNPTPDKGTKVIEIRIDQYGELLTRWPGGFFSERDKELFS